MMMLVVDDIAVQHLVTAILMFIVDDLRFQL